MSTIEISDVGPIESITIDIPEDKPGGVVLLKGDQGTGKTQAINAIRAVLGKKMRLIPNEKAVDKGKIKLGDRTVTVGGTTTRKGDLEVGTIEERFDINDLIYPAYDDADVRNSHRIKALIDVAGVKPDIAIFYDVVGGKAGMDALLAPKDQETPDLVDLCAKLKRAIEKKAGVEETLVESAESNARAAEGAAAGIDTSKPDEAEALTNALTTATTHAATLKQQRTTYSDAKTQAEQARAQLAEHEKSAVDVTKANLVHHDVLAAFKKASEKVVELRAALKDAEAACDTKGAEVRSAKQVLDAAEQAEKAVKGWRDQIAEFEKLPQPNDADIVAADTACSLAREAVDDGAEVRMAKSKLADAERYRKDAAAHAKEAKRLREQAASVYGVLTKQIPKGPLYVAAGQLVVDTDDREKEPYDRLSDGERWKLAIPYAVNAVGDGGFLCCPQDAWQHLSPTSQSWVAQFCHDNGVWLITGTVANGPLRSEVFTPTKN